MGKRPLSMWARRWFPSIGERESFTRCFKIMERKLIQAQVETYYLEVLQQNADAVRLYQKHGFAVEREYAVLRSGERPAQNSPFQGEACDFSQFDFSKVSNCVVVKPCFEHSTGVLQKKPCLYGVRYRKRQGNVFAFCVYAKENGAFLQLGYEDLSELKLVLQSMVSTYSNISVKNIDTAYPQVLELLHSLQFKEVTRQFEMSKKLS